MMVVGMKKCRGQTRTEELISGGGGGPKWTFLLMRFSLYIHISDVQVM